MCVCVNVIVFVHKEIISQFFFSKTYDDSELCSALRTGESTSVALHCECGHGEIVDWFPWRVRGWKNPAKDDEDEERESEDGERVVPHF